MKPLLRIIQSGILAILLLMATACGEDGFLDINTDPNNAAQASNLQLLPTAQANYALGFASMLERAGATLVQHYLNGRFDNYGFDGSTYNNQWAFQLYSGALQDFQTIIDQGTEDEEWQHVGISKIQQAYIFSLLVDLFGDVPFSQALQGQDNFNPTVDLGEDIYPQLISLIEEGLSDLEKTSTLTLGSEDLIYGGNLDRWRQMAATLLLKMWNQQRLIDPDGARGAINKFIADGNLISSESDNFTFPFTNSVAPEGRHPNFQADYAQGGLENNLSSFMINLMTAKNDPRVPYYFYKQSGCNLTGRNGGEGSSPGDDNVRAIHGIYPIGGKFDDNSCLVHDESLGLKGAGIFPMLTNTMRLFIEAEAALTLGTTGDPRMLLEEAINASFQEIANFSGVPMDETAANDYIDARLMEYDAAATEDEQLEVIMMEKYVAMFGNGIESYNDLRRTGYPENLNPPVIQNGPFPLRLPIPPVEVTANENIDPALDLTQRVFWDVD